jgi:nicotinate-nucleotide pyrophosphorylase (carboxylating)
LIPLPEDAILREAACRALGEDRGPLDLTTTAFTPADTRAEGRLFVKQPGVLSGIPLAARVFYETDELLHVTPIMSDGQPLQPGDTVMTLAGSLRSILIGERSALNFLQHLSGIATQTARFVAALAGTHCQILDTRKTTPGLRHLEKYAVRCGGGRNHRYGLYDGFLVKDNHLALEGGMPTREALQQALARARDLDNTAPIIFEADTLEQVSLFAGLGVDRILLDNMTLEQMRSAVALVAGRCPLEASGNMTLDRVRSVAETGVDFISVGALTHSVSALDFSLEVAPYH